MKTEMAELVLSESMGGNAGFIDVREKKYPCSGANGFFDPLSGEIKMFGNWQDVPEEIKKNYFHFIFRVVRLLNKEPDIQGITPVVGISYWGGSLNKEKEEQAQATITKEAKKIMRETIEKYNISGVVNFEGLYKILEILQEVKGTKKTYSSLELIDKIERIKKGELPLDYITRSGGLREKVAELLKE